MGKLSKFKDVDVFASLSAILKQNTGFYQSDFDIDKSIITQAAASPHKENKTLLWLCRPMGTHCFRERDVFLKDTAPHNTWRFYREQTSDRILAYAIELKGTEHGKIKGNLYELDYARHYECVKDKELAADTVRLIYEHGTRDILAGQYFAGNPDALYGKFERVEAKLIRPFTPRHNGKVERSHRKDNERFYATHTFYSFEDFRNQLKRYNQRDYNNFPMRPLDWKTPNEVLRNFCGAV